MVPKFPIRKFDFSSSILCCRFFFFNNSKINNYRLRCIIKRCTFCSNCDLHFSLNIVFLPFLQSNRSIRSYRCNSTVVAGINQCCILICFCPEIECSIIDLTFLLLYTADRWSSFYRSDRQFPGCRSIGRRFRCSDLIVTFPSFAFLKFKLPLESTETILVSKDL